MPRIFISYRRQDSAGFTGHLRERLEREFGKDHVFQDIEAIAAGAEFTAAIERSLDAADVQLVVIGKDWLTATDDEGRRRLDNADDYVAREVEVGLAKAIRVIPILADDATMPHAADLPERLRDLASRNARTIREARFAADVGELIQQIGGRHRRILGLRVRVAAIVTTVVAVVGLVALITRPSPRRPKMNELTFNLAVARFQEQRSNGHVSSSARASELGDGVADSIRKMLPVAFTNATAVGTELWGSGKVGHITGTTSVARARSARELAARINADVVIYGVLQSSNGVVELHSGYLLTARLLKSAGAADLAGTYDLQPSPPFREDDIAGFPQLKKDLVGQSNNFGQLIAGLVDYAHGNYIQAATIFRDLDANRAWVDPSGRKALYLFLGKILELQHDLAGARRQYERAIALDPRFPRALIARANVEFQLKQPDCLHDGFDQTQASRSLADLAAAGRLPDPGGIGLVTTRVAFYTGRILWCEAFAGIVDATPVREAYEKVVAEFEGGNSYAGEMAGSAHADLGAIDAYLLLDLPAAVKEYKQAITIARAILDTKVATYLGNLGCVYLLVGDVAAARSAQHEAVLAAKDPGLRAALEKKLTATVCT